MSSFKKIHQQFGGELKDKTIAVWGLAFKPRTDDIREAPALVLIDALLQAGRRCGSTTPSRSANVRDSYGDRLAYCDRPYGALEQADALAIVTEWNEFRNPDFEVMRRLMRQPVIFDGRNVYDPRDGHAGIHLPRHRPGQGRQRLTDWSGSERATGFSSRPGASWIGLGRLSR